MIPKNNDNNSNKTSKDIHNKSKRRLILAGSSIAVIALAAALLMQSYYTTAVSTSASENSAQQPNVQENNQTIRRPPPSEISMWGNESASIEAARATTGVYGITSLPTHVPEGLKIASIRTSVSPIANFVSVFYTPAGVTAHDNDTAEKIMSAGGMLIIYSEENMGPKFNQTKWLDALVSEGEGVRHLSSINGQTAILVDGNQANQFPSEVLIIHDAVNGTKVMTDLVSLKYSPSQLAEIAESITAK